MDLSEATDLTSPTRIAGSLVEESTKGAEASLEARNRRKLERLSNEKD